MTAMDAQVLTGIMSAIALIVVAVIETKNSRSKRKSEERAERRQEESRLAMQMMAATCKLSTVTAKAVTGQKTNGDVEEALKAAGEAQQDYEDFKTRMAAQQVAKV